MPHFSRKQKQQFQHQQQHATSAGTQVNSRTAFSASKDFDVDLKHVRREFEPETKTAGDHMLFAPWREMSSLSSDAQFSVAEVMHLSHSTEVQTQVIPYFIQEGNSVICEAKTGSGKTLAFIIPLVERLRRQNQQFIDNQKKKLLQNQQQNQQQQEYPFLSRNICSFIVSPSRVLAQQTFIVGRTYACRYPYALKFFLIDRHVEPLEKTAKRMRSVARGGGFVAVGTVTDVHAFHEILQYRNQHGWDDDEEEHEEGFENNNNNDSAMQQEGKQNQQEDESSGDDEDEDEDEDDDDSDLDEELKQKMAERRRILKERKKKENQQQVASKSSSQNQNQNQQQQTKQKGRKPKQQKQQHQKQEEQQQQEEEEEQEFTYDHSQFELPVFAPFPGHRFLMIIDEADVVLHDQRSFELLLKMCREISSSTSNNNNNSKKISIDFGFFGATATSVKAVCEFANQAVSPSNSNNNNSSNLETFQLSNIESDAADLRSCYDMVAAQDLLQSLVHVLNAHPSKKHFVFFNQVSVLNFVHRVLVSLASSSCSTRPSVLKASAIFVLHEGMKDAARFEQFGKFVRYDAAAAKAQKQHLTVTTASASYAGTSGSMQASVSSAILLCTDEAAFGLDVRDVDYVVHFEAPPSIQNFVHRSGRVARMGMSGTSILLLPRNDRAQNFLKQVSEKFPNMQKFSSSSNCAPITATISAFVGDIVTGSEEAEKQNMAQQQIGLSLPARRVRGVGETQKRNHNQQQQQHQLQEQAGGQDEQNGDESSSSKNDVVEGSRLFANAVSALCRENEKRTKEEEEEGRLSVFTKQEAIAALAARAV